jgi:dipeptidyl-peptidase-4
VSLPAQVVDSTLLNLDRIFKSREFSPDRFGPAKWLSDGSAYTTLEPSQVKNGSTDIIKYDAKTGTREVMVPATSLIPEKDTNAIDIEDYEWSTDGKLLLIYTNSARVWRQNTRGDYWVYNSETHKLQKLGGNVSPSTLMFAKISPDGSKVGYVCKNNLFSEDLQNNKITQLTFDGSRTIINGTFDWVNEEEFDLRDGFRWSPDSKYLAYWQLDAEGVSDFNLINNTDSLYSKIIPVQYPKVGTTLSAVKVGVVNTSGGSTKWFDVPGDPRNNYIGRMEWAGNSEEIVLQHLNRIQNTDEVMLGNINTGTVKTILTEKDDAWVDVVNDLKWLNDGKNFTWISERDGWRHVYTISRSGDKITLITQGNFDV